MTRKHRNMIGRVSRRRFLIGTAGVAGAAALSACVARPAAAPSAPAAAQPTSAPAATAASAFPVTIEHKFGSVTVPAEPKRVIALGYSDQDPILALGVKPIATRLWWGDEKMAAFPWAQDELGDAKPEVLNMPYGELNFEKIAALKPDLIVATYGGLKENEYETLSNIAPTLAQSGAYLDYGMPWQEVTLNIGKALGRESQAKALVADIEARFEAVRAKHPDWAGKSVIIGAPFEDKFGFMASQDPRSRFFAALGFQVPAEFDKIAGDSFYGTLSSERVDLLNTDLLVFHQLQWVKGGRAAIEADPLLSKSESMKNGRAIYLEGVLDDAFQFNSVLSLPMVLDEVVPMIEAVMGGDSAITAPVASGSRDALIAEGIAKARAFKPALTPAEVTGEHRLIKQGAFGDAKVPLAPRRIVTLDPSLTDTVIALGYGDAIVGTIVDYNGDVFHEHIADLLKPDTAKLGQEGSPNLERVVAVKPDLILTWDWYPDNIAQLQQIAPTVVMPYTTYEQQIGQTYSNEQYVTWLVREVAAVLGLEDRVDAALKPFRDKKAAGRAALQAGLGDQKIGFVDIRKEKILLSGYGSDGISALLYGDLGVRPDPLTDALYVWKDLSLEKVPELTADQMLAFVDGDDAKQRYQELTKTPLWQKVPAVKNGKVFIVPSGLYYRGDDGPLGAAQVVDDIVLKLTGKPL